MRALPSVLQVAAACIAAAAVSVAHAQPFPSKPLRLVVPFPAGGSADLAARVVAQRLGESFGQPVVVDNRAGANGAIGAESVVRAPKDGYTLLLGSNANITINPHIYKGAAFDPVRDLTPVAMLSVSPLMLFVNPDVIPVTSVRELTEYVKARPGKLDYASAGNGSQGHLAAELLVQSAGLAMVHVPYKGGTPAVNDVLAGRIGISFAAATTVLPHVRAGKLRGLATTGQTRPSFAGDLPTMIEAGVPGYVSDSWWGAFSPRGTPPAVLKKLGDAMTAIAREPQSRERFAGLGVEPMNMTPAELGAFVRSENQTYARIVKEAGITGQ